MRKQEIAATRCMMKRYQKYGIDVAISYYDRWCKRMPSMNHGTVLGEFLVKIGMEG